MRRVPFAFRKAPGGGGGGFSRGALSLTSQWKAPYAGDPWVPSVGSAGNLTAGTGDSAATVGATQNGKASADLSGTAESLQTAGILSDLFTAGAGGLWLLFKPRTAGATGAVYAEPGLLMDTGADYFALSYTTSGVRFTISDGAYQSTSYVACATGSYHLVQAKWDGSNASLRVDGSAAVTVAAGNLANLTRQLRVGANYTSGGLYLDGLILELATMAYAPTSTEEDNVRADIDADYALSL